MDYDFWLRAAALGPIRGLPELLAIYRFHGASKSGDQEDWRPFYAEWHQCYERHRQADPDLAAGPLLTVALPWGVPSFDEEAGLRALLARITGDKFRDMEVLVVADAASPVPEGLLAGLPVAVRVERAGGLSPDGFVDRAVRAARGRFVWFPPAGAGLAGKWFLRPLNALLDDPGLASAEIAADLPPHGFLPGAGGWSGRRFYRTAPVRAGRPRPAPGETAMDTATRQKAVNEP